MKLNIAERFSLMNILPTKGNFILLQKVKIAQEKLIPTDEEIKKYAIITDPSGRTSWNKKGSKEEIEIGIGEVVTDEAIKILKKKNEENTLAIGEVSLYEKFIENVKEDKYLPQKKEK